MLKQILATSALIAIATVSAQSANAADSGKFRQLVVEPAGASAEPVILKKKKFPTLIAQPGKGIQTPSDVADAGNGNAGGNQRAKFIVAPSGGIPTPADTADVGNGKSGGKAVQFVVAPGQGLPTPAETGGKGKPKKIFPTLAKASGGIATPIQVADVGPDPVPSATKTFPLIVNAPEGLSTPAGETTGADAQPADPVAPLAPAGADQSPDGARAAPLAAAAAPAVQNPKDLYTLLTGHGYGVEILKRDANGNLVFYVTTPGNAKAADLLLVDVTDGKVIERKHIATYAYDRPSAYTPRYATAYAGGDDCEHTAGY
jgi:hypothetical protein